MKNRLRHIFPLLEEEEDVEDEVDSVLQIRQRLQWLSVASKVLQDVFVLAEGAGQVEHGQPCCPLRIAT